MGLIEANEGGILGGSRGGVIPGTHKFTFRDFGIRCLTFGHAGVKCLGFRKGLISRDLLGNDYTGWLSMLELPCIRSHF